MDTKQGTKFNFTEKFKTRALELLDESNAKQFVEGLRISGAMTSVLAREQQRLKKKHGDDHERVKDITAAVEASTAARASLFARYKDAVTPQPETATGWSVDGFVRLRDGSPLPKLSVGAWDRSGKRISEFGAATTDERGYFVLEVKKLTEKTPKPVFLRVSRGQKVLTSNVPELDPVEGRTDRVEIIVEKEQKPASDKRARQQDLVPTPVPPVPAPPKAEEDKRAIKTVVSSSVRSSAKTPTAKKAGEKPKTSKAKSPAAGLGKAKGSEKKTSPKARSATKATRSPAKMKAKKKSNK